MKHWCRLSSDPYFTNVNSKKGQSHISDEVWRRRGRRRGMVMEEGSLTLGTDTSRLMGRKGGGIYIWICKKKRKRELGSKAFLNSRIGVLGLTFLWNYNLHLFYCLETFPKWSDLSRSLGLRGRSLGCSVLGCSELSHLQAEWNQVVGWIRPGGQSVPSSIWGFSKGFTLALSKWRKN